MTITLTLDQAGAALAADRILVLAQGEGWLALGRARDRATLLALPGVEAHELGPTAGDGALLAGLLPSAGLRAQRLVEHALPGPVAIRLGAHGPRVRRPDHPLWTALVAHREPLLAVTGSGPMPSTATRVDTVPVARDDRCVINAGQPLHIEQAPNARALHDAARVHLLCVCTGNTCRSPLLAGLLRHACAIRGLTEVLVESAGSHANSGDPASANTEACLRVRGIDLDHHRSRSIDDLELSLYDRFLCMTPGHIAALRSYGIADDRIQLVDPAGVPDPFGGPLAAYEACAATLEAACQRIVDEL